MIEIPPDMEIHWLPRATKGGVRIGRSNGHIVVEWPGVGRLISSPEARGTFMPDTGVDVTRLVKFQATELLACRRYLSGRLSLHGSAVQLGGGAIALVGDSGAGKSTMAMALVEYEAAAFFADDVVPIDWQDGRPLVPPAEDSLWLDVDSREWFGLEAASAEKQSHPPRLRAATPGPLLAVVHLAFDDTVDHPEIGRLTGQAAFVALSRSHICYPTEMDGDALRSLEERSRLASAVPVFFLRRQRSMRALRTSAHALAQALDAIISGDVQ